MLGGCRRTALAARSLAVCAAVCAGHGAQARADDVVDPGLELAAARALFAEALRDEQARHFGEALAKFELVRSVRDTAPVEYRIGSCNEGLGRFAAAYRAYRGAVSIGRADPESLDVTEAARERLQEVTRHVSLLAVALSPTTPADATVRVDGAPLSREDLQGPVVLDPGHHLVTASARDRVPSRSEIVLPQGARVALMVALEPSPLAVAAAPPPGPRTDVLVAPRTDVSRTIGWVGLVSGGTFIAAAAVVLWLRSSDISALHEDCPAGLCPADSNRSALEAIHERAVVEGPVAFALGAAGAIAAATGALVLAFAGRNPSGGPAAPSRAVPLLTVEATVVGLRGSFR
jgi:hypothetical protein